MNKRQAEKQIMSLARKHRISPNGIIKILELKGKGIPISFVDYKTSKAKGISLKEAMESRMNKKKEEEHLQFNKEGLTIPTINWMDMFLIGIAGWVFYKYIYNGGMMAAARHESPPQPTPPAPQQI